MGISEGKQVPTVVVMETPAGQAKQKKTMNEMNGMMQMKERKETSDHKTKTLEEEREDPSCMDSATTIREWSSHGSDEIETKSTGSETSPTRQGSRLKVASKRSWKENKTCGKDTEKENAVIKTIAQALWNLALKGDSSHSNGSRAVTEREGKLMEAFRSGQETKVGFLVFVKRLVQAMNDFDIEMSCENKFRNMQSLGLRILLTSLVLVDRLMTTLASYTLSTRNVHRVILSCMLIVSKFSEDEPLNNQFWSKVSSVPLAALNACELCLVQVLDYKLRVPVESYEALLHRFELMPMS